ncbi:MAG: ABC transporter permease [Promethearchaeota archaeon]
MRNIVTIASREFRSYLYSPMAYIISALFLGCTGLFFGFIGYSITQAETSLCGFLGNLYYILIVLMLNMLLTMRLIAEERKLGTIELLLTAPVKDSEIILGKFFSSMGIIILMLVLTFYFPILLVIFGDPDFGPIASGYLGLLLLSSSAVAIGIFASSLTSNQIVSAVIGGAVLLGLWFLGYTSNYLPEGISNIVNFISLSNHYFDFIIGIIDTRSIIYFVSITAFFIFLAIRSLENSRWN